MKKETAPYVICTSEEYFLLDQIDFQFKKQELIKYKNHYYDRLTGIDATTGRSRSFYFDVTFPYVINGNRLLKNLINEANI